MQRTIRVLAIISAGLVGLSLVLLVASLPFQQVVAQGLGYPAHSLGALPMFPLVPFLLCLLRTGCIALLIVCCGNKKGGIWLEILMLVILAICLPFLSTIATIAYDGFISLYGSEKSMANSVVSIISSYCCHPASLGQVLAYISCGMSITFKIMNKKQNLKP